MTRPGVDAGLSELVGTTDLRCGRLPALQLSRLNAYATHYSLSPALRAFTDQA
jgi:hypothetical protein